MTIEKFYETLNLVADLDRDLGLQSALESINSALANLVNSPAAPAHQSSLATALVSFTDATEKLGKRLSSAQSSLIGEIGEEDFFDPLMAEKVQASVSANAMTPSVARDFVADLANRRSTFLATVKQTLQGLGELNVTMWGFFVCHLALRVRNSYAWTPGSNLHLEDLCANRCLDSQCVSFCFPSRTED